MADTIAPIVTVNPMGGTYSYSIIVSLISDEQATIYYTLDGNIPTILSSVYSSPLSINSNKTLKYFAKDSVGNTSTVQTQTYIIDTVAPLVTISPLGGIYSTSKTITLLANEASTIYYTLDGSVPTTNSSVYSSPITIISTTTLNCFAKDSAGNESEIQTQYYTIDNVAPAILASIPSGTYSSPQTVTLATNETATIYYTLDGSNPTVSSAVYTTALSISLTTTLKVIGKDSLGNLSAVKTFTYIIIPQQSGLLGSIDRYKKPEKARLFLCKPNKQTLAELSEAMGIELKTSYNGIHELSFRIPYKKMKNNKIIDNSNFNNIRGDYLIRYLKGDIDEYFVIDKPSDSGSDKDEKNVHCYLSPYSLGKVLVRNYKDTKPLYDPIGSNGFLNDTLLKKTNWSVDYVDTDLMTTFRTVDVTEQSLIEFMSSLNDAFSCISIWDTKNEKVSFYKENDWGTDKGLLIEEGKYLKSINGEPDFESVATRLYVYGKENLTFNSINPTGSDYIEDFSYYMYPFERDANKNTIKESFYMSNELCHALLNYNVLVESKKGSFKNLITQKETLQDTQTTKENELTNLQIDLAIIQDSIDVAKVEGDPTTDLDAQKIAKQTQIDSKQSEVDTVIANIASIDSQIAQIKSQIAIENNFTPALIIERKRFIKEKIMNNQYISDEKELYDFAVTEMKKISQPLIHYSIDIVDFTKVVQCQRDWNKLVYGDIVTVRYPKFNVDIKARIISITQNEDNNSVQIEIANSQDIKNGFLSIKDLLQKATSSSTSVDTSKYKWDKSEENADSIASIINSDFDAFNKRILAGVDESVEISRRGILIKSTTNPDDMTVMQAGAIGLSKNGQYKVAMSPERGIVAEVIKGKLLVGVNLSMENQSGKFKFDKDGVTIDGAALTITGGVNKENLSPEFIAELDGNINELNQSVTELQTDMTDAFSDGKITLIEAHTLKTALTQLDNESTDVENNATTLDITTENTNYANAVSALDLELTKWVGKPTTSYPLTITQTDRDNINAKFGNVQSAKSILLNKIAAVREQRAKDAGVGLGVLYNGVKIDAANGMVVTKQTTVNNVTTKYAKTTLNATEGIKIQTTKNNGTTWDDSFYVDLNGVLTAEELVAKKLKITNGNGDLVIDANTGTIDFGKFANKFGVITGANLDVKGITVKDASNKTTFSVDSNGNLTMAGDMVAGSISGVTITGSTITTSSNTYGDLSLTNGSIRNAFTFSGGNRTEVIVGVGGITFRSYPDSSNSFNAQALLSVSSSGLNVSGSTFLYNANEVATQAWVTSNASSIAKFG